MTIRVFLFHCNLTAPSPRRRSLRVIKRIFLSSENLYFQTDTSNSKVGYQEFLSRKSGYFWPMFHSVLFHAGYCTQGKLACCLLTDSLLENYRNFSISRRFSILTYAVRTALSSPWIKRFLALEQRCLLVSWLNNVKLASLLGERSINNVFNSD